MQLASFFNDSPLWVSFPGVLGNLAVTVITSVLMVRLLRMKL